MRFYIRWAWRAAFVSAVLTIMGASPCLAWQQGRDDDLEPGTFLIAPRRAADPSFASTVVLLVRTDESGALGLVINRPTNLLVSSVLQDYKPAWHVKDRAFSGGPVQRMAPVRGLLSRR